MCERANNQAERQFKVGDRVLLKNTKRNRQGDTQFDTPGAIEAIKSGTFTVALESGGPSLFWSHSFSSRIVTLDLGSTNVGANLLRHCPPGPLAKVDEDPMVVEQPASGPSFEESMSPNSVEADMSGSEDEADPEPEDEADPEPVVESGNMLCVSTHFSSSTAPKNFANAMRKLPPKRRRKKQRPSESYDVDLDVDFDD